ncbi:unnamed protein product [Adineta ricciae]|uniref:Uncharacterized protein n=1 Tax=Adineta ricciae TaxID=249248 RepID=A0A814VNX0_ADIRI|nr:unnamed protein product [Adineta ricciae]CAF1427709.1 unnamed protein product [Adineta ricciae]
MLMLFVLLYGISFVESFRLFHTNNVLNNGDHDCLYRYMKTGNELGRHLISYCIRSVDPFESKSLPCYGTSSTFLALRQAGVNITDLLDWHSPLDLIAAYADYLETGKNPEQIFCNCSDEKYFGVRCQYSFALNFPTFDDLIEQTFIRNNIEIPKKRRFDVRRLTEAQMTCYQMSNCTPYVSLCLDWRQICDGIRDCTNGHDEENCLEMELNECDPITEYRCRNGLCIPRSFSFDLTMDCMDFYDEQETHDHSQYCHNESSIDCDDHSCGLAGFSCGDGSCFQDYGFDKAGKTTEYEECQSQRNSLYIKDIFSFKNDTNLNYTCWQHMWCLLGLSCLYESPNVQSRCQEGIYFPASYCRPNLNLHLSCPQLFFFPPPYYIMPYVQLLYNNTKLKNRDKAYFSPPIAICYNSSVYDFSASNLYILSEHHIVNYSLNYECRTLVFFYLWQYNAGGIGISRATQLAVSIQNIFSHVNTIPLNNSKSLFQCANGRLISIHRIVDRHADCFPHTSDESSIDSCNYNLRNRFQCVLSTNPTCIPRRLLHDNHSDCLFDVDEIFPIGCTHEFNCQYLRHFDLKVQMPVFYQELCNGHLIFREKIEGEKETDETNCDEWPCNARAIRCNGVWNRPNGCDELHCPRMISNYIAQHVGNCSENEHYCFQYNSSEVGCLPLVKAGDGTADCLFASDERWYLASQVEDELNSGSLLPCHKPVGEIVSFRDICNGLDNCNLRDDELLCPWRQNSSCKGFLCKNGTCLSSTSRCNRKIDCIDAEDEWACDFGYKIERAIPNQFEITRFSLIKNRNKTMITANNSVLWLCHRGILIYDTNMEYHCLCPPSYHGSQCQYQSERLTVSFRMDIVSTMKVKSIYQLIFYLLDEEENPLAVESYIYALTIHLSLKHLIVLTYPRTNQSSSSLGKLSLRIDSYIVTQYSVDPSVSWFFPVQFPFLPVNRLAVRLVPEQHPPDRALCHELRCKHGVCEMFSNVHRAFCRCFTNWAGSTCDREVTMLNCRTPSVSAIVNEHALCICPLGRTGHHCQVAHSSCDTTQCQNGGTCVSLDIRTGEQICLCPEHFSGTHCQNRNSHSVLSITCNLGNIPVLIVHFLYIPTYLPGMLVHRDIYFSSNVQPNKPVSINDEDYPYLSPIIVAQSIHEPNSFYGSYYLVGSLEDNRTSLTTSISPHNRCPHVSERLNSTLMNFEWLKRIKFYHKYFRNVTCFYDEIYMCLVDEQHVPECLYFNHAITNCTEKNYCENDGRCLQKKRSGQINFACACPKCITGTFCQIRTTQFFLTLDSLLGGVIITDAPWSEQSILLKVLTTFAILMFIIGIVSNLMSFLTCINSNICKTGSGNYLLVLSFVSLVTIVFLAGHFIHLLISQITVIKNRRWLIVSCTLFDFLLSFLVSLCDWLTACIACERTSNSLQGVRFSRRTSVRAVKIVIPLLVTVLLLVLLHRPFNQDLLNDPYNNERSWCIIKFRQPWLQYYTIVINVFNTTVPFLINFVSAIVFLVSFSRTRQRADTKTKYSVVLRKQFYLHKDLIISPCCMIVFKVPWIITMLIVKCIESPWQLYLTVVVYCLSLMPLTTTFLIFIVPAPAYWKVFLDKWHKFSGQ